MSVCAVVGVEWLRVKLLAVEYTACMRPPARSWGEVGLVEAKCARPVRESVGTGGEVWAVLWAACGGGGCRGLRTTR